MGWFVWWVGEGGSRGRGRGYEVVGFGFAVPGTLEGLLET